ncbi:RNA polymerase sigma factor [Fodinibius salsisoli]|uniref:RNA polymerase sigma-70 factor n=1 Tax=Fodinibius salsisoli TaxID=2820877 RepID=A0ABT3PN09_9BACT|nr:RNA polymerase sigma-70 factor [Fodinibius salsisoli]MCW9707344.1 RNA polymerase sigma-70 factor [Fodinibius salsisoli]
MGSREQEQITVWARRIKASDEGAFSELFHHLYARLVKFAWRYTKSKALAKDIVQESFVKLWKKRQAIDPDQSLLAYVFQIVRNSALNYLRDHPTESIALDDLSPGSLSSSDHIPEVISSDDETGKQMIKLINQLPNRQREAIRLSRFEGLDHEEIAYVMDISSRTVNNHIVKAIKTLKKEWSQHKQNQSSNIYYD